jgi:hypothetical protein
MRSIRELESLTVTFSIFDVSVKPGSRFLVGTTAEAGLIRPPDFCFRSVDLPRQQAVGEKGRGNLLLLDEPHLGDRADLIAAMTDGDLDDFGIDMPERGKYGRSVVRTRFYPLAGGAEQAVRLSARHRVPTRNLAR